MKTTNIIAILGLSLSTMACATVTRGTNDSVEFTSTPSEAKFSVTNVKTSEQQECISPCELKLSRKGTFDVKATKEGYVEHSGNLTPGISGGGTAGMAGNLLLGGVVGAGVDAATGAMNNLNPNPYNAVLEKLSKNSPAPEASNKDSDSESKDAGDPVS